MKLKNYREDLLRRLRSAEYAADYLEETRASGDATAFVIAFRDVVDARGGGENASQIAGSSFN